MSSAKTHACFKQWFGLTFSSNDLKMYILFILFLHKHEYILVKEAKIQTDTGHNAKIKTLRAGLFFIPSYFTSERYGI